MKSKEMRLIDANALYNTLKEDVDRLNRYPINNRWEIQILLSVLDLIEGAKTVEWRENHEMPGKNR